MELGGGGPRSAVENEDYVECAKCTGNAGSARERPGVTWRERSPRSVRSTVESMEHPGVRGARWDAVECGGVTGITWSAVENADCHGRLEKTRSATGRPGVTWSLWSVGDSAKHVKYVEYRGVRGVPRSMWSAAEYAEYRGVPRSTAEYAEYRGVPRSTAEYRAQWGGAMGSVKNKNGTFSHPRMS